MNATINLRKLVIAACAVLSLAGGGWADETNRNHNFVFSVTEENDLFTYPKTDKHYTQGLHIGLLWPDEAAPWPMRPLAWVPDCGLANAVHQYGVRIGQDMYTPKDMTINPPDPQDRPYAGWLFLGLIRNDRGTVGKGIPTRDHLEVDLGVVGRASLVSDTQIWWHKMIGSKQPEGWPYQLRNEPGFLIAGDRQFKIWDTGTADFFQLQFLPHAGFYLGNVQTALRLGTQLRLGHNLPNEFAKVPPLVHGWYLFGGVDGRAVGYNEFLDGNAFQSSRSVAKEPVVLEAHGGLVLVLGHSEISYTYNYLSKEFKTQDKYDAYGSVNFTQTF